jgi:hypothetical protein
MANLKDKAHELYSWVGNACSDIAYDQAEWYVNSGGKGFSDTATKYFDKLIKNGCPMHKWDLGPSYADELYNDPDTLCDLLGDRIHDALNGMGFSYSRKEEWLKVWNGLLDELAELGGFGAWEKAISKLRKD